MSFWVLAFIGGLLSTQIVNPFFWFRLARGIASYNEDVQRFHAKPNGSSKPKFRQYSEGSEIASFKWVIWGNIACFGIIFVILCTHYYFDTVDRTFSSLLARAWLMAIGNFISTICTFADVPPFSGKELLQAWACSFVIAIIWLTILIHGWIYGFCNHVDANTFLTETEVPVISVDVSSTLEKEVLIQGYTLKSPINRNGKVIFPMSRTGNISIAGYVELTYDGTPIIVEKDLHYTPYQAGSQNIKYVARDYLPTKQFFGDWSFQLAPNGDVYFAIVYGDFASLRAGRVVTGILLVNATTGECSAFTLNKVPDWVSGISE